MCTNGKSSKRIYKVEHGAQLGQRTPVWYIGVLGNTLVDVWSKAVQETMFPCEILLRIRLNGRY